VRLGLVDGTGLQGAVVPFKRNLPDLRKPPTASQPLAP